MPHIAARITLALTTLIAGTFIITGALLPFWNLKANNTTAFTVGPHRVCWTDSGRHHGGVSFRNTNREDAGVNEFLGLHCQPANRAENLVHSGFNSIKRTVGLKTDRRASPNHDEERAAIGMLCASGALVILLAFSVLFPAFAIFSWRILSPAFIIMLIGLGLGIDSSSRRFRNLFGDVNSRHWGFGVGLCLEIVAAILLLISMSVFSLRTWRETSNKTYV